MGLGKQDSISGAFVESGLNNFKVILRKCIYSLYTRIKKSMNSLLGAMLSSVMFYAGCLMSTWNFSLFNVH